jgi:PAS domain S-box-containing protein
MILLDRLSHKNKIFFASVAVILLVSVGIALVARWVLVSSLITRMEQRGVGIAESVAEESGTHVLTVNRDALNKVLYDASRLGNREALIAYMFVLDLKGKVLGHTFSSGFPEAMLQAGRSDPGRIHGAEALSLGDAFAYDITYPVKEGGSEIGVVHVGLSKGYIDEIISRLRITFLGFISVIIIIFFGIAHWLSGYITRPMGELIRRAEEISRGNLEMEPGDRGGCSADKGHRSDEIEQLADAFDHMTTSIRASREQLRESEQKYRYFFDSGPNPVFVVSRNNSIILDANPAAAEAYDYDRADLIGRPFDELGTFEYGDLKDETPGEKAMAGMCVLSSRARHYRKGNQPFYVNVRACPGMYQGREVIILATNDVTEIMEKDAQLIQAGKMKSLGEMSAGIAHELNQPLNAIKMGNDFLILMLEKGRVIPPEKLSQVAKEVSAQVSRSSEIIMRLRDFARKADFSREQVDLNNPIDDVVKIFGQQLKLQGIDLTFLPGKNIPPVLASNNRLEQVFFNLLSNARDAIVQKRGGLNHNACVSRISIRSFSKNGLAVVAVSDTGAGISKDAGDKIFEPFFTTKEVGKGMGLGLAIIYEIVVEHGGEIRVHSGTGIGTTFVVLLPHIQV